MFIALLLWLTVKQGKGLLWLLLMSKSSVFRSVEWYFSFFNLALPNLQILLNLNYYKIKMEFSLTCTFV